MTEYQTKIVDKMTQVFRDSEERNDWKGCHIHIREMLLLEISKSFRNGVKWARRK